MRAASREALSQAYTKWAELSQRIPDLMQASKDLFNISDLLASSERLTNALTDPGRSAEEKSAFATSILQGKVLSEIVELLCAMSASRWSTTSDLTDSVRELAVVAALADADKTPGNLAKIEDEALGLAQIISTNVELRMALRNRSINSDQRSELIEKLIDGKVTPQMEFLAIQGVKWGNDKYGATSFMRWVAHLAGKSRDSLVASVTAAIQPSQAQLERLTRILESRYGCPVLVHLAVDENVLGGMRVIVNGEVVDGSIAYRLADLKHSINK